MTPSPPPTLREGAERASKAMRQMWNAIPIPHKFPAGIVGELCQAEEVLRAALAATPEPEKVEPMIRIKEDGTIVIRGNGEILVPPGGLIECKSNGHVYLRDVVFTPAELRRLAGEKGA